MNETEKTNEIDKNIKNEMNREIETHREKNGLNRQNEMNREIEAHEGMIHDLPS